MKSQTYFTPLLALVILFISPAVDARLYFMHVPKTGGTTLRLLLEMQVSADEIYPCRNRKTATQPVNEDLVSGHLPYWFCKNLDPHFDEAFKITALREPVERYLSFLRAKKKADPELPDLASVLHLRLQPNNKYQDGLIDNALCRYLAGSPDLEGEALLESAKQNLQTMDCVIFFNNFNHDVKDLFRRLGIPLRDEEIPRINTTTREDVPIEVLEEVKQLNELDMRLYTYARENYTQGEADYLLRTSSFDEVMKTSHSIDYTFDLPLNGRGWTYREMWEDRTVPHPVYRWVMDKPAEIYFPIEKGRGYLISVYARPIAKGAIPKLDVNGFEIQLIKVDNAPFSLYQGFLPGECLSSDAAKFTFHSDEAFLFSSLFPSHYNRNHPPLSFAVNRIVITPYQEKKTPSLGE